jgi:hypothetical protein
MPAWRTSRQWRRHGLDFLHLLILDVGWKPYGVVPVNSQLFSSNDPFGWKVSVGFTPLVRRLGHLDRI